MSMVGRDHEAEEVPYYDAVVESAFAHDPNCAIGPPRWAEEFEKRFAVYRKVPKTRAEEASDALLKAVLKLAAVDADFEGKDEIARDIREVAASLMNAND